MFWTLSSNLTSLFSPKGIADAEIPFQQALKLAEAIPGAQLVTIEGADHFSTSASKKAILAIQAFLQKNDSVPDGEKK